MRTRKRILGLILIFIAAITLLGSCNKSDDNKGSSDKVYGLFTSEDFIKTSGKVLKNQRDEEIILRGTNAGGYLIIEQWMSAVAGDNQYGYYDHKKMNDTFLKRFGSKETLKLWEYYREKFWTHEDFYNCASMGMNVIRLPFSYMSVDPDYYNVRKIDNEKYNFEILDSFIEGASEAGLYVILDMHGAYGSHNGQDHGTEYMDYDAVDFYKNKEKMDKTVALWKAISNRYKDNPAVAGYDLLNEPGEKGSATTKKHWDFLDRLYKAIRENGDEHVVIFESCWDGWNLPRPEDYGWLNCMYSFHNYSGESDADKNLISMLNKINGVNQMNFEVPYYMGEFNCYGNEKSWELTLELFNGLGWSWTSWTYKLNRERDDYHPGWGIYYTQAKPIKPNVDSVEVIKDKWFNIDTSCDDSVPMRFNSLNTLENVMRKYLNN